MDFIDIMHTSFSPGEANEMTAIVRNHHFTRIAEEDQSRKFEAVWRNTIPPDEELFWDAYAAGWENTIYDR